MSDQKQRIWPFLWRAITSAFGALTAVALVLSLSEIPEWTARWEKIIQNLELKTVILIASVVILVATNVPWLVLLFRRRKPTPPAISSQEIQKVPEPPKLPELPKVKEPNRVLLPPIAMSGTPHIKVPPKPRATLEELRQKRIEGRSFYIWELLVALDADNAIVGKHIESCDIKGPAIVRIEGKYRAEYCTFGGGGVTEFEKMVWLVSQEHSGCGALFLKNCTILKCRFESVGIVLTRGEKSKFGGSMTFIPS